MKRLTLAAVLWAAIASTAAALPTVQIVDAFEPEDPVYVRGGSGLAGSSSFTYQYTLAPDERLLGASLVVELLDDNDRKKEWVDIRADMDGNGKTGDPGDLLASRHNAATNFTYVFDDPGELDALAEALADGVMVDLTARASRKYGDFYFVRSVLTLNLDPPAAPPAGVPPNGTPPQSGPAAGPPSSPSSPGSPSGPTLELPGPAFEPPPLPGLTDSGSPPLGGAAGSDRPLVVPVIQQVDPVPSVPEPPLVALLGLGAVGLLAGRRRHVLH